MESQLPLRNVFRFIVTVVRPYKYYILGQFLIGIVFACYFSLQPYLIKTIIDKLDFKEPALITKEIILPMGLYILCEITIILIFRLYDWILLKYSPLIKHTISQALMNKMLLHSHRLYQNNFSGSFTNKINDCVKYIPKLINLIIDCFFTKTFAIISAIYTVTKIDIKFSLAILAWVIILILISLNLIKKSINLAEKRAEEGSRISGFMTDVFSNIMSVRLFNGYNREMYNLSEFQAQFTKADQNKSWFFLKVNLYKGLSFTILQIFSLYWLYQGIKVGKVTPGDFALIFTLNISIIDCLWNFSNEVTEFSENLGNINQALRLIEKPLEITNKLNAESINIRQGEIEFHNVNFGYLDQALLFKDLSIKIPGGQKVGLVGYSGGGKSSFINLLLRLFDVKSGSISIDNQNIQYITQDSLRDIISMIPQEPYLFHRTLMENIKYGNFQATDEEVIEAAKKACAHDFIAKLPEGYNTLVGERGVKLSGGQRQRITIARAILKNSSIVILDEATSNLDSVIEAEIQKSLYELFKDKTSIVIAHRLSTLLFMDRILVFEEGKVVEDGTHEELLLLNGLYKLLWNNQVAGLISN